MTTSPSSARPRLGDHVRARRYVASGAAVVVLHDGSAVHEIGEREWALLEAADGTRDLLGIAAAAARRGVVLPEASIQGFFDSLREAGLLHVAVEAPPAEATAESPAAPVVDRPIEVLPGFSLSCDGRGSCCRLYSTILFSPLEVARARAALPSVLDGGSDARRAFLPERSSRDCPASAVTLVDGHCAYLANDGGCRLHALGGAGWKPQGCNVFPTRFVDDGETVRVGVTVECACVLASVGREGGAPLIDPSVKSRSDISSVIDVHELPADIEIARRVFAPRADIARWSRRYFTLAWPQSSPLDAAWALAAGIEADGLTDAWPSGLGPLRVEIAPRLVELGHRASRREREHAAFRSQKDLFLRGLRWLETASLLLENDDVLDAALAGGGDAAAEAFTLRAMIFAHQLVEEGPIAESLRWLVARMLLARVLPTAARAIDDPLDDAAREPLAFVLAISRAAGI